MLHVVQIEVSGTSGAIYSSIYNKQDQRFVGLLSLPGAPGPSELPTGMSVAPGSTTRKIDFPSIPVSFASPALSTGQENWHSVSI